MRESFGQALPRVAATLPGPRAAALVDALARTECPALTARRARRAETSGASHDPIVWARAHGANVEDVDGNVFVDLTAGFGAAAIGHGHSRVVESIRAQTERLLHALGDVHPSDVKVALLSRLAGLAPFPDARVILGLSGADAIEAALKTAMLATKRPGVLAFVGGYHGLSYGALATCGYKDVFRAPFTDQMGAHVTFAPYPAAGEAGSHHHALAAVRKAWDQARAPISAVLFEPAQGRGGIVFPPRGFLAGLGELAHERGALLIADEIFTGLGRCGATWLSVSEGVTPDLVVTGKALGGGLPVSACLGRREVMSAWGAPGGEAIHTSTFLGHPLACAAALATLEVMENERLAERAVRVGEPFRDRLRAKLSAHACVRGVRGVGLMLGVELDGGARGLRIVRRLLERGYIVLPAGPDARVLSLTPPLAIEEALLDAFAVALDEVLLEDGP